jgi:hypothetical protein
MEAPQLYGPFWHKYRIRGIRRSESGKHVRVILQFVLARFSEAFSSWLDEADDDSYHPC